ncbi:iron complex outermembrane receptor protein [Lacibacter cauensis]|uniref:Iron complex outermembrane receptor protein n=1 Tax=Lacibacter cauensis TaxID=510947 RepID=A0A562SR17_9BACT|nr:TonB-dependent receptor [Lacibacter cauensis]TWI83578.1 iron complex outermembrane receptor protein [Lacibacter cauensis]
MNRTLLTLSLALISLSVSAQNNFNTENRNTQPVTAQPAPAPVVKGVVRTSDGKPAGWVNVLIKETNNGTITNEAGEYFFYSVPEGRYTLIVSFTGLKTVETVIDVKKGDALVQDFVLTENKTELQEIVIAYFRSVNDRATVFGKSAIKPMDLPQAIATVSEVVMKEQQAQRLSDVVKNVNGVYLSTTRASTQESFSARGYGFSSTNMFRNGSRVNSGAMPEVSSLESVEILKGGAAILYGNVAPGGVLNMVTKKPKFDFGGEASLRAGSFNLWKPTFDVYGPISKKIAYRLNGTFETTDSYRAKVSSKRYYINPSFLFKLGNKTELILEADYLKHDFTPDFGVGSLNNTIIPNVHRSTFMGTEWQYNVTQQSTASATVKHAFNDKWQLSSVLSYQNFDRDYYAVERIQAKANGDWGRPLGRVDTKENYFTGQVNLNGKFKTWAMEHTLLAGIDADRYLTETYNYDIQGKIYDSINILDPNKFVRRTDIPVATRVTFVQTPVNRLGAYVQDLISITPKLKLLAGIRWSLQESVPSTTTYLAKDSVVKGKIKVDRAFSPRFGLVYRMKPNVSFFASYSNSFAINTGLDIYNNVLPASIIDQYEIGVKNILLKGKLTVNVTAYKIINNNLAQTAQFDRNGNPNNNSNLKELTGQTTSNGIEVDVTGNFVKGLSMMAGYSYNDMRYTNTPDKVGSYIEGDRLVNIPAHTANASAFYTFSEGALKRLKIGAGVYYIGDRIGGWNNTQGQSQNYSRMIPVKAFTTVDITAGYNIKRFTLLAKLANVGNVLNYYVHENYSVNPIAPRSFVATVSYKF